MQIVAQSSNSLALGWGDSLATNEVPSFTSMDSNVLHTSGSIIGCSVGNIHNDSTHGSSASLSPSSVLLPQQELTDRAVAVVQRVLDKLTGLDFPSSSTTSSSSTTTNNNNKPLAISEQIDRLINEATSNDNLSTCYMGWCPLW